MTLLGELSKEILIILMPPALSVVGRRACSFKSQWVIRGDDGGGA